MDVNNKEMARRIRLRGASARPSGARRLRGQAMVLFLVLVGVLCLGAVLMFNTGQTVQKKVHLTNTADAAAYSVAVQQARAMNFVAYMNRGRIANEVAVAQMVSLWSWMNMYHTHAVAGQNFFFYIESLCNALSLIPGVAAICQPIARAANLMKKGYQAAEKGLASTRAAVHPLVDGAVTMLGTWNLGLANAADLMLAGMLVDGIKVARDVVDKNDKNAKIPALAHGLLLNQIRKASTESNMLDRFKKGRASEGDTRHIAGMNRYRNVVMASRDYFSADRTSETPLPFIKLKERGGTDMVDYDRWVAVDALDLNMKFWKLEFDISLGFGGAQAVRDVVGDGSKTPRFFEGIESGRNGAGAGWYYEGLPGNDGHPLYPQYGGATNNTAKFVEQYPSVNQPKTLPFFSPLGPTGGPNRKRDAYLSGHRGLQDYSDINQEYARTPEGEKAGPIFTVLVESDRKHARTSEDTEIGGPANGQLELNNDMSGDKMRAIASAQVYFNRPPAHPWFQRVSRQSWKDKNPTVANELEMGSLFSPYWQARLIETPAKDYLVVLPSLAGG
ncbi:pilus assembly protein TadG-related protein [Marilutibacter alkalisoli]|nr:pilus assembly protein TadG-related protein [Lysobacter alkalisoli]